MTKLKINKCQCIYCLDVLESKHRHDFQKCSCGAIFTDGGLEYIRRGYGKPVNVDKTVRPYDKEIFPIISLSE
jgi:hypothetical protein